MIKAPMLTTTDNPFNPFEDFSEWYLFDVSKGYNTCEKIARIVETKPSMSDSERLVAITEGLQFLMKLNPFGNYKILTEDEEDLPEFMQLERANE